MQTQLSNICSARIWIFFCRDTNLLIADILHLVDSYTYYSAAHNTTSWLDHNIVCTINARNLIWNCRIHIDMISSDHFPLSATVDLCDQPRQYIADRVPSAARVQWNKALDIHLQNYTFSTETIMTKL